MRYLLEVVGHGDGGHRHAICHTKDDVFRMFGRKWFPLQVYL
jgi:hypothetical protein